MKRAIGSIVLSLQMLFKNIGLALRYLLLVLLVMLVWVIFFTMILMAVMSGPYSPPLKLIYVLSAFFSILVCLPILLITAREWHRHLLLEHNPSLSMVPVHQSPLSTYLYTCLKVGLSTLIALTGPLVITIFFVERLAEILLVDGARSIEWIAVSFPLLLAHVIANYFFIRFGVSLPAAAIGNVSFKVWESWEATSYLNRVIWWLSAIVAVGNWLLLLPLILPFLPAFPHSEFEMPTIILLCLSLYIYFAFMFSISIITTLYGICVEGREI